MNAIIETINAAGQAFIRFALPVFIQSSVLILILLLLDAILRRKVRAVFRYWIWMLVLLKLVLPPSLWSPVSIGTWLGETLEPPAIVASESPVATQEGKSIAVPRAKASPEAVDWVGDGTTAGLTRVPEGYVPTRRLASASDNSPMEAPEVGQRVSHEPTPDSATAEVDTAPPTATPLSWQALVFLAWIAIALALLLLLIQRVWFVRGLIAQAQESPPRLRIALDQCRVQISVKRAVPIRVSSNATSPAVCGLFRPSILIPKGLVPRLQPHDLQAVLLHELAHIKRGDLWVNLIQTLLQVIYFYNPFLWLANLVIRRVREQAVDEAVLVAMGEAAHDYPETLLNVARLAFKQRPALSLRLIGVVESKSALRSRIKHILARPFPKSAKLGLASLIAIVAIGAVLLPMARAERHGMYVKGIDEILHVSDGTGHLTIQSLHMPAPDGKRLLEMNETFLRVRVENTSPEDSYLGLEYYADAGTIAGTFSPGASARTEVLRVPANWQGTLTYPVAYPRFVHDGYIRIVLAKCSDLQTKKFLSPEAEVLHEKTYPVHTDKQVQDSGDRFALLPDCGVWLSDIDGQDLPILDLASERIITLPNIESDFRLLQTTTSRGEGDVLYYYDRAKGLPRITFLRGAALGDASASDEGETRTIIPPELPWQATLTTAEKAGYEIRITRADEQGCAIHFRPMEDASDLPKAILPGGIAVELVGLCKHPSAGKPWWRPNGSALEETPYDRIGGTVYPDSNQEALEFAIRLRNLPAGADTTLKTEPGGSSAGGSSPPMLGGKYVPDMRWLATSLPKDLRGCQLLVGIATGPWEATASATGESYSGRGTQLGGVMFSQAVASDDDVTMTISDDILERPCRVVAITKDARTLVASATEAGTAGQARQTTAHFKHVAINDIAEFQFQTRPWTWVTFSNVSLKPGYETDVAVDAQVALEDREPQASKTDAPPALPLTERAARVIPLAEQEARRLNHAYVGTEHILLALARQEEAVSAKVLTNLGADLDTLRAAVNKFVRPGLRATHASSLPRMPRAERIMQHAAAEARALNHNYIGTEHILLGLMRETDGVAPQVLASLGVTSQEVKAEVLKFVQPGHKPDEETTDTASETKTGKGAGGGALAMPPEPRSSDVAVQEFDIAAEAKPDSVLQFRIIPKRGDIDADIVREYVDALEHGRSRAGDDYVWFETLSGIFVSPDAVTREHDGKSWLLLWNKKPFVMRPDEGWRLERLDLTNDDMDRPGISLWFDAKGSEAIENFTEANTHSHMAMVVDGWVISAPMIITPVRVPMITGPHSSEQIDWMLGVLDTLTPAPDPAEQIERVLKQWLRDLAAGDMAGVKKAYRPDAPQAESDARDMEELLSLNPGWQFSLLSVAWNDEAAMAVSGKLNKGDPKSEPEPVVIVWNLDTLNGRWVIADIDLEQIEGLQRENSRFLKNHPGAQVWYVEPGPTDGLADPASNASEMPSAGISGRVLDLLGMPAAGAQVAWIDAERSVSITDGRLMAPRFGNREEAPIIETDAQGWFRFEDEPNDGFILIAAHDTGFAQVGSEEFDKDRVIRLRPWGRIEGQVAKGRFAEENKIWMGGLPNSTWFKYRCDYRYETLCDSERRFAFGRVPPGWFEVGYLIETGEGSASLTSRTPVVVESSKTTTVTLGGEGRPVVGRFVPPPDWKGPVYFGAGLRALDTVHPERPTPDNYDQMTQREQQEWLKRWSKTPEAEAYRDAVWHNLNQRHYTFRIADDGMFRIEDVIPGEYKLTVWLEERFDGGQRREEIGGYSGTIEVPPMDETYSDDPLDVGDLVLRMRAPLHVGDMAPLFEARTLDGKEIRLFDCRGRFVLLNFWSPVFNPEMDRLKKLQATYDKTGKLQIIGLGGTDTLEEVKKYVEEHAIEWPEIYFGPDWDGDLFKRLGGQMQILLIDPEGEIVATWLRGEKLTDTVREAIEKADLGISGRVLDPNGLPVPRAMVMICGGRTQANPRDLKAAEEISFQEKTLTDAQGRFRFGADSPKGSVLIAYHRGGIVMMPYDAFKKSHTLRLTPWPAPEDSKVIARKSLPL